MRTRAALAVIGALGWAAFPACSACSGPTATILPHDGGPDGLWPKKDSGADADVDLPDATEFDAGFDPFVGTWGPVPGAPQCGTKLDLNPQKDIGDLQWSACPSGRPGCKRLVVSWTSNYGVQVTLPLDNAVRVVAGVPYLSYGRWYPRSNNPNYTDALINVVAPMDKPAIFAIGDFELAPRHCGFNPSASNTGIEAVGLSHFAPETPLFLRSSFQAPQQVTLTQHLNTELGMYQGGVPRHLARSARPSFSERATPSASRCTTHSPIASPS